MINKRLQKSSICYISDMGHHYREPIFRLMAAELGCHFYFGNKCSTIKPIDYKNLPGFMRELNYIRIAGNFHFLSGAIKSSLNYKKIILLGDPHGIHNWVICFLSILVNKDVYLWSHGLYGSETWIRKHLKLLLFRMSKRILTYGEHAKRLLIKEGISEKKITVINNSLDHELQLKQLKTPLNTKIFETHFRNTNPTIVFLGRIQRIKRLDLLVEMASTLKKEGEPINVVLIGSVDDDDAIGPLIDSLGLTENFWLYGPTYDEREIYELLSNSDICVSPGNVGLTAIHALTYGCPVITHNNFAKQMPEFESIIPGITGDFFEYNDLADLTKKTREWLGRTKKTRAAIKAACLEEVQNRWTPSAQIKKIKDSLSLEEESC